MTMLAYDPTGDGATVYGNPGAITHDDVADQKDGGGNYQHNATQFSAHEAQSILNVIGYMKSIINSLVGTGVANLEVISQTGHGFTEGTVLTHTGLLWTKAKADLPANAEGLAIVQEVNSIDSFTVVYSGKVVLTSTTPWTANTCYFLSATVDGGLTASEPTGTYVSKPMLFAISSNVGIMYNLRGVIGGDQTLRNIVTKSANYSAAITDDIILCDVSASDFTVTMPSASSTIGRVVTIKKIDTTGKKLTILPAGSDKIDGQTSWFTTTPYSEITIASDGTNWHITGR